MSTTFTSLLDGAALLVAGALAGNELAVALVHAQLARLDERTEARAARPIARFFGRVMPGWYALTLLLAIATAVAAHGRQNAAWALAASAAALYAASIVVTVVALVPINNGIAAWDLDRLPPAWREDRRRWDERHRVRVAVLLVAFTLLVAAVVAGAGG